MPELIMEYMLTFVVGCCCPLQSSLILSYVKGSSTAGTDILESHVEWLAMDPEFQRYLENCTIVAMISFLVKE